MERSKGECICGFRRHKVQWITCTSCSQRLHASCAKLSEDEYERVLKFFCLKCSKRYGVYTTWKCRNCRGCFRSYNCDLCQGCLLRNTCDKRRCIHDNDVPLDLTSHERSVEPKAPEVQVNEKALEPMVEKTSEPVKEKTPEPMKEKTSESAKENWKQMMESSVPSKSFRLPSHEFCLS